MNLLFLTPQVPYPPHQGTTIRNWNILRRLAASHTIDLITFSTEGLPQDSPLRACCRRIEVVAPPARSNVRRALETFFSPWPDMARRLASTRMADLLAALVKSPNYDFIQVEGIEMGMYWLELQQPVPAVFDDHNAEYLLQRTAYISDRRTPGRWLPAAYSYLQGHKLARFEREICLRTGRVAAVSKGDAQALTALDSHICPVVIPNGVDISYYNASSAISSGPVEEFSLVFTGKMDFRPNVDAALWFSGQVLPRIRAEIPTARVSYVGQQPPKSVQALKSPGIEVTGWVDDTRPYIAGAAVYVVPLRMGGGTRLKVLEAMAMGKAIVSTSLGAAGIDLVPGRDLIMCDRADEFARATVALLRDPARRRDLGENARKLVEQKYDWDKIVPRFEALYQPGEGR